MSDVKMPEVEVSLRLAIFLATSGKANSPIDVAIDGAQVKIGETVHFDVVQFMNSQGWQINSESNRWQGIYSNRNVPWHIRVHSQSGIGDVTTILTSGQQFIAESKKGTMNRSKSSSEYPLIREAIGQLMTIESVPENPFLAIAIPAGERFLELTARWRSAPLLRRAGISLLTVSPTGEVQGW